MNTHTASVTTAKSAAVAPKQATGASVNIPPRRLDFEFPETMSRYYFDNSPFLSSFLTTLSALFPEGESFFVESVRAYRDQITDPVLRAQVSGFIGQEAMHSKEHASFNEAATRMGYPVLQQDKELGYVLRFGQRFLPKAVQISITTALEHYTAIIAEMLLRDPDVQQKFSPEMRQLWLWHALEENEHKTVAYDVYEQVSGSYLLRAGTMIPVTAIFFAVVAVNHTRMLAADGKLTNFKDNWNGLKYCWGGRKGVFSRLLPVYLDYFRPDFHPNDHDTSALLDEWREKLFGNKGLLTEQLKTAGKKKSRKLAAAA